jgi:insertion element IS1 protein InsB
MPSFSILQAVNVRALEALASRKTGAQRPELEVELDEMQSFVGDKEAARWLWHALDHRTGHIVAYVVGSRADDAFLALKTLLGPFGITHYYADKWGAYQRHLPAEQHTVGKCYLQKIERKHLTLRTRLKRLMRQTLCFSRSIEMHDLVIGLFINRYEFGEA